MISDKSVLLDDYKARIKNELQALYQAPVSYDTSNLLNILDDFEMEQSFSSNDYIVNQATIHLLVYIVSLDFINAKHLWNRFTETLKKDEKLKPVLLILKAALNDDYTSLISNALNAKKSLSGNEDIKNLLDSLIPVLRSHIIKKITRDFVNIPLADISKYLNLEADDAKNQLTKKGWKMLNETIIQTPKNLEISDKDFRTITEAQFKNLTQTISFLETI